MQFFKKTAPASRLAVVMWEGIRNWPTEYGPDFRQDFGGTVRQPVDEVLDEIVYFLAYAADYAFWNQLGNAPEVRDKVRNRFGVALQEYAQAHSCSPMPVGGWLGDTLIWMPGEAPQHCDSLTSLQQRLSLYGESLSRRQDRSAGERTAHVLAALCGTTNALFVQTFAQLFLVQWEAVRGSLNSYNFEP